MLILISVVAGVVAAAGGGPLTRLGDGFGGLYGLPALLLASIALVGGTAGTVATIVARRRLGRDGAWVGAAIAFVVGLWVIAIGYTMVAHAIDPCVNGWWDASSRIGSQPLCERFGREINWHTRFHLLAHAAPSAALLGVYVLVLRRFGSPRPEPVPR